MNTPAHLPSCSGAPRIGPCQVLELRRYQLHPGRRHALIDLFEQSFIEPQQALGMAIAGPYRDLHDADAMGWLRGFTDMGERGRALPRFYGGPVWATHREAANATMRRSDDVHLLRQAWPGSGLQGHEGEDGGIGHLQVVIVPLSAPPSAELLDLARHRWPDALARAGAQSVAWYATEPAPDNFARLPVHEGRPVLVGLAVFPDTAVPAVEGRTVWAPVRDWARACSPRAVPQELHWVPTGSACWPCWPC
jgi:hypothetical protein